MISVLLLLVSVNQSLATKSESPPAAASAGGPNFPRPGVAVTQQLDEAAGTETVTVTAAAADLDAAAASGPPPPPPRPRLPPRPKHD